LDNSQIENTQLRARVEHLEAGVPKLVQQAQSMHEKQLGMYKQRLQKSETRILDLERELHLALEVFSRRRVHRFPI